MNEHTLGQVYKVNNDSYEVPMRDKVGVLVVINGTNLGLDFHEKVGNYTWNLDGRCPDNTGRFMAASQCSQVLKDWDE